MNMPDCLPNLLILDDEESIRQSIAAYFEDEGFTVFQAASGEEALDIVKGNNINAAVIDIRLPGMDGNAFMVKAGTLYPKIKFIIHTGSADYRLPDTLKKIGVKRENVFIKPVHDLDVLATALKQQ